MARIQRSRFGFFFLSWELSTHVVPFAQSELAVEAKLNSVDTEESSKALGSTRGSYENEGRSLMEVTEKLLMKM